MFGAGDGILTVFESIVTAAVCANTRPLWIVALVFRVMLASARMFPSKSVLVPSVAELPTFQNKPLSEPLFDPVLIMVTTEPLAVVSVLPI